MVRLSGQLCPIKIFVFCFLFSVFEFLFNSYIMFSQAEVGDKRQSDTCQRWQWGLDLELTQDASKAIEGEENNWEEPLGVLGHEQKSSVRTALFLSNTELHQGGKPQNIVYENGGKQPLLWDGFWAAGGVSQWRNRVWLSWGSCDSVLYILWTQVEREQPPREVGEKKFPLRGQKMSIHIKLTSEVGPSTCILILVESLWLGCRYWPILPMAWLMDASRLQRFGFWTIQDFVQYSWCV